MKWVRTIGTWLLQVLLAVVMVGPGFQKFTGPTWERMFRAWGYPDKFYLVIGAIEVVGGVLLLVPKLASYSAMVLSAVMIGAAATQILRGGRNGVDVRKGGGCPCAPNAVSIAIAIPRCG